MGHLYLNKILIALQHIVITVFIFRLLKDRHKVAEVMINPDSSYSHGRGRFKEAAI